MGNFHGRMKHTRNTVYILNHQQKLINQKIENEEMKKRGEERKRNNRNFSFSLCFFCLSVSANCVLGKLRQGIVSREIRLESVLTANNQLGIFQNNLSKKSKQEFDDLFPYQLHLIGLNIR